MNIPQRTADATLNLALDTLAHKKQALIFCNTRRGAASQAEKIATKTTASSSDLEAIAKKVLSAVGSPTKQCKRLALCIRKGVAFHHAGLHAKQRELVETRFRDGTISIICSTPTLAMGLDLPAFRSIIRDTKRFSAGTSWGMVDIPVLEYEQMAGRAGRPGKEDKGEAILVAKDAGEAEHLIERYIHGEPEEIYSKLAVEPVLRTYVLSLIASGFVKDRAGLSAFFSGTFYAHQYGDTEKLELILDKMVGLLQLWGFLEGTNPQDGFVAADVVHDGKLTATRLGSRVAQLYLDPYTAHHLLTSLEHAKDTELGDFPLLHLLATTLEMRPLMNVKRGEIEEMDKALLVHESSLIVDPPTAFSHEYEEFLQTIKTAQVLLLWVEEVGDDELFDKYNVTPGELQAKRTNANWLLYSLVELAKLQGWHSTIATCERMRIRIAHGVREELLPLLRLNGVGRVRARMLFKNKIRDLGDVKEVELSTLAQLLGVKLARSVKEQVGIKVRSEDVVVKQRKRKGQINLFDYDGK